MSTAKPIQLPSQEPTTLDHAQMHSQHLASMGDDSLWRDELAIWQREVKQAIASFEHLKEAFGKHEERLRQHGAAVRLYEDALRQHEHALAEYEKGGAGSDLFAMARSHESEQNKHRELAERHADLQRQQHAILTCWNRLLDMLGCNPAE